MNKKLRPDVLSNNAKKMPIKRKKVIDTQGGGRPVPSSIPKKSRKDRLC